MTVLTITFTPKNVPNTFGYFPSAFEANKRDLFQDFNPGNPAALDDFSRKLEASSKDPDQEFNQAYSRMLISHINWISLNILQSHLSLSPPFAEQATITLTLKYNPMSMVTEAICEIAVQGNNNIGVYVDSIDSELIKTNSVRQTTKDTEEKSAELANHLTKEIRYEYNSCSDMTKQTLTIALSQLADSLSDVEKEEYSNALTECKKVARKYTTNSLFNTNVWIFAGHDSLIQQIQNLSTANSSVTFAAGPRLKDTKKLLSLLTTQLKLENQAIKRNANRHVIFLADLDETAANDINTQLQTLLSTAIKFNHQQRIIPGQPEKYCIIIDYTKFTHSQLIEAIQAVENQLSSGPGMALRT